MENNHFLPMGKIVGAHGVKGTIKVYSYAESFSVFKPGIQIHTKNVNGGEKSYIIKWAKPHKRLLLMSFEGIRSRDVAETLIGSEILFEKANLPELEEGTYYWADIIGLSVFDQDDKYIGRIETIIPTGSNDVYVAKDPAKGNGHEILIPALESVVVKIDLEHKTMHVDLPEGLV